MVRERAANWPKQCLRSAYPTPEAFLEALLNGSIGVAVLDRELRYTHFNVYTRPAPAQRIPTVA